MRRANHVHRNGWLRLAFLLAAAGLIYLYGERWLRGLLLYLSRAGWARSLVTDFPLAWRVASRFVAGESVDEAIAATRSLAGMGMSAALDYLGESVADRSEALAARDQIRILLEQIDGAGLDAYVSVKLSQLGVNIDPNLALENLRTLLRHARQSATRVRIDMEDSPLVDITLEIYRTLRREGFDNVGVVIQSYLYRSEADVRALVAEGAWVRLVKGAYLEPADIAYADKAQTDANFVRLMQMMLDPQARAHGVQLSVATHDETMIRATQAYARRIDVPADAYEFQLLYGIRRDLQEALVREGHRVRIYVPYGTAWYPYFVRRLAERPANLWFFVANLVRG